MTSQLDNMPHLYLARLKEMDILPGQMTNGFYFMPLPNWRALSKFRKTRFRRL